MDAHGAFRECVNLAINDLRTQVSNKPEAIKKDAIKLAEIRYATGEHISKIERAQVQASMRLRNSHYVG